MIGQAHHIRAARGLGIDNHGVRVGFGHGVNGALAVDAQRVLGGPEDAAGEPMRDEEREAGTDSRSRRHDDDFPEDAGHAQDADEGDAAHPVGLLGRGDLLAGPVARGRDDDGEGGAVGFGDAGEGVPFAQRVVGDADAHDESDFDVVEVDADGVAGEDFGPGLHFPETEPGEDDAEGDYDEEPEGRGADDGAAD